MKKLIILSLIGVTTSCYKDKAELIQIDYCESFDTVSFANEIKPQIIDISCNLAGCHQTGAGGYTWDTYLTISSNADLISDVIRREPGVTPMPLGQPQLSDSLLDKFDCWLQQGALDN